MQCIDTHCHLDGEEFREDLESVVTRAREAGVAAIGVPGINLESCKTVLDLCSRYPNYCYPMLGLHPEDVKSDWREVLDAIAPAVRGAIAIGEVGLHREPDAEAHPRPVGRITAIPEGKLWVGGGRLHAEHLPEP